MEFLYFLKLCSVLEEKMPVGVKRWKGKTALPVLENPQTELSDKTWTDKRAIIIDDC